MQINEFDNYIFDLDGTLINSSEEVLECFKKAFCDAKYDIVENRFTSDVIGPPLLEIIHSLMPELNDQNKIDEIIRNFRKIYDYDEQDVSVMYEGMCDVLHQMKKNGKNLFIATFKPSKPTKRLVEKFGINTLFIDIYTIDKYGKQMTKSDMIEDIISKYSLNKSKTVMVGDAVSDIAAAKAAGILGIGVMWGYGLNKTALKEISNKVIESAEELL